MHMFFPLSAYVTAYLKVCVFFFAYFFFSMSSSAIVAAKKRIENSLRNFQLPNTYEPEDSNGKNGVLALSLLQSRLHWSSSVFIKYKPDPAKQPRRTNNTRKKWPNMRYLGSCTLELGPHLFPDTLFYEAVREQTWSDIGKQAGISFLESANTESVEKGPIADTSTPLATPTHNSTATPLSAAPPIAKELNPKEHIVFTDIVMEFKDVPNERFIFPKDIILELTSMQAPFELRASFLLPLDPSMAEDYFLDPTEKIERWGSHLGITPTPSSAKPATTETVAPTEHYPANIRMSQVDGNILKALVAVITKPDSVRQKMTEKMQVLPVNTYLRFQINSDTVGKAVEEMMQRIYTTPEITSGPVLAEKKRNELLNAISLGKRPPTDPTEEPLKSKHAPIKDDEMRKCLYCSTRQTAMWRKGPAGSGTLCNGCGLLWKQNKILKGAPVITREEERRVEKRNREKERLLAEELAKEKERQEQEQAAKKAEMARQQALVQASESAISSDPSKLKDNVKLATRANIGFFAAQLLQQQHSQSNPAQRILTVHPQKPTSSSEGLVNFSMVNPQPIATRPPTSTPPILHHRPMTTTPMAASTTHPATAPLSLYSSGGIPLPTLSIDFGHMLFAHPNCGVTLIDHFFSIRLCKEGYAPTTLNIDKRNIQQTTFQVIKEGQLGREVLIMTCVPENGALETLLIKPSTRMRIQFLEKLDPSGGAVVKRILERWLSTLPSD
ncbi:hypothetical protein BDF14DRAFT_1845206 [Spinellus fusiger]|nr:hypothetical protein BDF14DRAFT_1845206 [Spinellus fusiger]